jgi:hypothetical protein
MARATSNRILLIIAALSIILVAISAVLTASRDEEKLSPTTPEGVVQLYLKAIIEGKNDQAATYFASGSECDASDIDRAYLSDTLRVNLVSTSIEGESAYVKIDANTGSGGPFEDGYTESHTYRLVKQSGSWRIEGLPWPLWDCGTITK